MKETGHPGPYVELKHSEISSIRVFETEKEAARAAAGEILRIVGANPLARITYATGNTMIPVYEELGKAVRRGSADFTHSTAFHLDEYYPVDAEVDYSFRKFLRERVFGPLGITDAHELNGLALDPVAACAQYDSEAAGADLVILGIGPGGHIAFNESGTPFNTRTHVAPLSEETVTRDRIERGQNSPDRALTQGIGTILEGKEIILVAYGKEKGLMLDGALYGPIGEACPASALRLAGQKVRIFIDREAASQLRKGYLQSSGV